MELVDVADDCLGLLAKYWQPGQVKTRLARSLGDQRAAEVSHSLLVASVARFGSSDSRRVLAFSPDEPVARSVFSTPEFAGWQCIPQVPGDLGVRISQFFSQQFTTGAERVVVLGGDSPHLPLEHVDQAFLTLKEHDAVLGPTDDGGYYLVGLNRPQPSLFEAMPWSTPALWQATIDRLREQNLNFATLPGSYDIDEIEDLQRLRRELEVLAISDPELDRLRRRLAEILEER